MMRDDYLTQHPEIRAALRLVNEGTEYFNRTIAALPDSFLDGATLLPEWSRRHVISHVAFNAQALLRLVTWAATGVEKKMYESADARKAEIDEGAALPPAELRKLHQDSADALDAAWRELSDEAWNAQVRMATGPRFPASATIWLRTREVWIHAVDLDSGASFVDFPPNLIDHLLANVVSSWRARQAEENIPNFVLTPYDRGGPKAVGELDDPDAVVVSGPAVDLARWATGRSFLGVTLASGGQVPTSPRWI